jgi:hypothetical protein
MRPEDVRRWIEARRAAAAFERDELRRHALVADPIGASLALTALLGRLHGFPLPPDAVTEREDLERYERWARLRQKLGGR